MRLISQDGTWSVPFDITSVMVHDDGEIGVCTCEDGYNKIAKYNNKELACKVFSKMHEAYKAATPCYTFPTGIDLMREMKSEARKEKIEKAKDIGIDDLGLSIRTYNCVKRAGYNCLYDILVKKPSRKELSRIRNMGPRSLDELLAVLEKYGYVPEE